MILIEGGSVLTENGFEALDVLIGDDCVIQIGVTTGVNGAQVIDATGCLVGPGFVDLHVHFRDPGETWKEDFESGSIAAATGGFTAVVAMPNTEPPLDNLEVIVAAKERARKIGLIELAFASAITKGRLGVELVDVEGLYDVGVRVFSDDGDSVSGDAVLREVMTRLSGLDGAVVAQHAEDASATKFGHMHHGEVSRRLGIGGMTSEAESNVVSRDLQLVRETGARYHCQHVSSERTVDLIGAAKQEGLAVTAEVTPHHLVFTDEDVEQVGTDLKMYPPVRTARDRACLVSALNSGIIDVVATDHAPHTESEKSVDFDKAPRGVIGLETAAAAVSSVVSGPQRFFEVMSRTPARIGGFTHQGGFVEVDSKANLVVFDPDVEWVPRVFASRSANSPFQARQMRGRVKATVSRGNLVYSLGATNG